MPMYVGILGDVALIHLEMCMDAYQRARLDLASRIANSHPIKWVMGQPIERRVIWFSWVFSIGFVTMMVVVAEVL